ncbi:hypothetical protein TELCIR_17138, partial [Teladorsagia circumcincta]
MDQLFRKKSFKGGSALDSQLKRCLGVVEVMFIAVGQMVGAGLYVLAGTVVHKQTGPSIVISFLCAGFAALMSAFSYAEFGARFFPFGLGGTLSGAATCFFAFVGFEALATAGEEAKNPRRTIPLATFGCLGLVTFVYVAMSGSLTLMLPYQEINPDAAFADAFDAKGATVAKYIITVGALAGMFNNL